MHRREALLGMLKAETLLVQYIAYTSYTFYSSSFQESEEWRKCDGLMSVNTLRFSGRIQSEVEVV